MNHADQLVEIARRKERLIARIEGQRNALSAAWRTWEKPAALVDRGIAFVGFLRSHPLLMAAGVAMIVVLRPRKLRGWLGRGLMLWRIWHSVRTWLRRSAA